MAAITGHKGKKLIDMTDYRHLRNYGYSIREPMQQRHTAIRKAAAKEGFGWVDHRLSAVRTLLKNTEPALHHRIDEDFHYAHALRQKSMTRRL
jgi:hypothetical protein